MASLPNSAPVLRVSALPTGTLHLPDRWLFEDGSPDTTLNRQFSPDYSFLIEHPSGKKVLFDLGIRKDLENNPEVIQKDYPLIEPKVRRDAVDILATGGLEASDIDAVIFSHLHFDHVGDCTKFPDAEIIAGPGSREATTPGWPRTPESAFLSCVLEHPRYRELQLQPPEHTPFSHEDDFFSDSSLLLVSTPGHMPGHLGALVHTGLNEWTFLGGDCCHHRALLAGRRPMSTTFGPNGTKSFHADPTTAAQTIAKLQSLDLEGNVFVALPHDASLMGVMPLFPGHISGWKGGAWKRALDERLADLYPSLESYSPSTTAALESSLAT